VGDDREGQRGDVGVEEPIEAAADAVIVEVGQVVVAQAQPPGDEPRGPLADAGERLAGDEEVLEQEEQAGGGRDLGAGGLRGEPVAEELLQAEPLEEALEDGQGADAVGVEGTSLGLGNLTGSGLGRGPAGP
jgi:hypothetical protein